MTDTHVKINAVSPRIQYVGNGTTKEFPYPFAIFAKENIIVYFGDIIQETGYTVSGAGSSDGGYITFTRAPSEGTKITIIRNVPIERITDFQDGGSFRPKNINDELDRLTVFCQQNQEELSRSVKIGVSSDIDPSVVIPKVERIYDSIDNVDTVAGISDNVSTVATNIYSINNCSINMDAIKDAPNQALSASNSAELARQYGNDKINQTHITNCITEIPQDIKLELNDGTLTLKAGSKLYVPNGADVFDVINIEIDKTISVSGSSTFTSFIYYSTYDSSLKYGSISDAVSGSSLSITGGFWYDTTNNTIKRIVSSEILYSGLSFPIAIVAVTNGTITSIDQVFNGFGYIGSTVFSLPGVKGLIPNGRNEDGSLKNIITSDYENVKTVQVNPYTSKIAMYDSGGLGTQTSNFRLKEQENYNYDNNVLTRALEIAGVNVDSSSKITSFTAKTAFHALDYNDFSDLNDKVVHKSGDETIAGNKTFTGTATFSKANDTRIVGKASDVTRGSTPANNSFSGIVFRDKNNSELAAIYSRYNTSGEIASLLYVKSPVSDSTENISLGVRADNTFYTRAPTPVSTSNDTSIATTAWVRSFAPYLKTTYVNGTSGYRIWSDGYCEQWGFLSGNDVSVTLIKKYKNTNYEIYCQWWGGKSANFYASDQYIRDITQNSFHTNGDQQSNVKQRSWRTYGYLEAGQY